MVAIDLEAIQAPGMAKAGGHCAIVSEVNGEMKVLLDVFVLPRLYEGDSLPFVLSRCSARNKRLTKQHGMPFDDAVKRIKEILQHSIVVGHNVDQDLDALEITRSVPCCVYDIARCTALPRLAGLPVQAGEKPPLKGLALLNREIQKGKHHPDEDAFASLQLYLRYKHLFEEAKALPRGKGALDISFSPFFPLFFI